jgi:uncharacterized protein YqeY
MTLNEKLSAEIKAAMIAKNADRLNTLRMLKSALGYVAMEKKVDLLDDAEFMVVAQKEVKKRKDSITQFTNGGRPELAAKEQEELLVIEEFLPKALSVEETKALITEAIAETGATSKKQMGLVIKAVQAKAAGRADGKTVSTLVGEMLPA